VNFSVTPLTGNPSTGWALYGGTSTPGYLNSHYAANSTGSAGNTTACATWNFPNILPGYYEVWATWRQGPDRSGNAPFTIYDGSTSVMTKWTSPRKVDTETTDLTGLYVHYSRPIGNSTCLVFSKIGSLRRMGWSPYAPLALRRGERPTHTPPLPNFIPPR
jgi:hypothetical protein